MTYDYELLHLYKLNTYVAMLLVEEPCRVPTTHFTIELRSIRALIMTNYNNK